MIIAFMGNDGSGKTTIAKELIKIFRDLEFEVIYKHEYQYTILKLLFKLLGKRIESGRKKMIVDKEKSWKYFLWPFLVWFDGYLSYIYFKLFKRSSILILDRYLFDHYVSFKYLGYLTKLSEWLFIHSPKPDVPIILDVEEEILLKRKARYKLRFYQIQRARYLKLSKDLKIKVINTNCPISDVLEEIKNELRRINFISENNKKKLNKIQIFFSKRAKKHEEIPSYLFQKIWKFIIEHTDNKNLSVLDMGCGAGAWTRKFKEKKCEVIGMDISEGMLYLAGKIYPHIEFIRGNIFKTHFKDRTFDIVFLGYVLHHFSENEIVEILKEAYRVIKENGIVISVEPNLYNPLNFLIIHPKSPFRDNINHIPEERPLTSMELKRCYSIFNDIHSYTVSFIPSKKIEKCGKFPRKILKYLDEFFERIPFINLLASNVIVIGVKKY